MLIFDGIVFVGILFTNGLLMLIFHGVMFGGTLFTNCSTEQNGKMIRIKQPDTWWAGQPGVKKTDVPWDINTHG